MKLMVLGDVNQLSEADDKRLKPHMANWLTIHSYIVQQPDTHAGLREAQKMLLYEMLCRTPRLQVVSRLYGIVSNRRRDLEQAELHAKLA